MNLLRSFLFIIIIASQAFSQKVSIQMPQSTGYVGIPMQLIVVFENVESAINPTLPEIKGFSIKQLLKEQTSQRTTIINGKITQSNTRAITFLLTPNEVGVFTIPALTFRADGKAFQSTPRVISIEQPPTGGVLKVEITGTSNDVYLGQPIDLTLRVFIEAFTDPALGVTLNARDMASFLRGEFGIFKDAIDGGNYTLQQVQGKTDAGIPTTFYVLGVRATTWPETAGPFHMNPVSVRMEYPLSLVRERSIGFFGGESLKVEQFHLISAQGELPVIEVLTPPSKDKPPWYSGAVGTYDFRLVAEPTHVKVGEPISITMRVTDRSSGPINLDFLSPPRIDRVAALTDHFRVPDTPLGGVVDGRTKIFTQSIRPRNDSTTEIPPLPMTSFDPVSLTYKTVWTNSIPISVEAVVTISAGDLVGINSGSSTIEHTKLTEVEGGILANYTGNDLLNSQRVTLSPLLITSITAPPLVFVCVLGSLWLGRRSRTFDLSTKGRVKRVATSIKHAATLEGEEQVQSISTALRELQHVRTKGDTFAEEICELLRRCDATQFGGLTDTTIAKDASSLMEALR